MPIIVCLDTLAKMEKICLIAIFTIETLKRIQGVTGGRQHSLPMGNDSEVVEVQTKPKVRSRHRPSR